MKILDVKESDMGTTVEFIGQVYEMEPNKYPSGKVRVVYKLQDETGKIWTYYWGSPIPDVFIDTWIRVSGKVNHYLKPPHTTPLVTVTWVKEDMEILTGPESLPQENGSAGNPITLPDPPILIDESKHLPTRWELKLLFEVYDVMKKYLEKRR